VIWTKSSFGAKNQTATFTIRVTDTAGQAISQAKALVFYKGGPLTTITDSNGAAAFQIPMGLSPYKLVVEKAGFQVQDAGFDPGTGAIEVQLTPQQGQDTNVVFRVVDDENGVPVQGASIQLLYQGKTPTEATDSNGIARFTLTFPPQGDMDVEISVKTRDYNIEFQRITLPRDRVQDVRLNRSTQTAQVREVQATPAASVAPGGSQGGIPAAVAPGDLAAVSARRHVPCADALAFGQAFECKLSSGTQPMTHTIEAVTDDVVVITVARTAELFEPAFQLFDANGNTANCGADNGLIAETTCTLRGSGVYSLIVRDRRNTNPGTYLVSVQRMNKPGNAVPLEYGKPLADALADIAQRNAYTFAVDVDDNVLITVARTTGEYQPGFQVYKPDGQAAPNCGGDNNRIAELTCAFPSAGTYHLQVADRNRVKPGTYRVFIQNLNRPGNATEVKVGAVVPGSISEISQRDTYVFEAAVDEQFKFTVTRKTGQFQPAFQVYNPAGQPVPNCGGDNATAASLSCTLPSAGRYSIQVTDRNRINSGDYELTLSRP
jgi:hypothetical protein